MLPVPRIPRSTRLLLRLSASENHGGTSRSFRSLSSSSQSLWQAELKPTVRSSRPRNGLLLKPLSRHQYKSPNLVGIPPKFGLARRQHTAATPSNSSNLSGSSSSGPKANPEPENDSDEIPPSGFRDRLRFLMRRYGWWALTVYLLTSAVDFSLVFAAIHFLGADHIRTLENQARNWIGMEKREKSEEEEEAERGNEVARKEAFEQVQAGNKNHTSGSTSMISPSLWAEGVLAYTIHKTLLLPFRVAVTAAITPSFVKLMVRWGWSRPNAVVQKAAAEAAKRSAAKKVAQASTKA